MTIEEIKNVIIPYVDEPVINFEIEKIFLPNWAVGKN